MQSLTCSFCLLSPDLKMTIAISARGYLRRHLAACDLLKQIDDMPYFPVLITCIILCLK